MSAEVPANTTLYTEGDDLYHAMLNDIALAQESVRLESYIFSADEIGKRFLEALIAQAQLGRKVTLRVDAAGSWGLFDRSAESRLLQAGVKVVRCHRWSWRRFWKFQRRNHRKLLVVDERVAYLGGYNVHRESSRHVVGEGRWRDTHARLTDAVVRHARIAFDAYGRRYLRPAVHEPIYLLPNRGLRGRMLMHRVFRRRFSTARERIWVTTPYFVPDFSTQRALRHAARRGVDVRVLVPGKSDVPIAQWAGRAAYSALLRAGVRIFEYRPRVLHAKTLLVDSDWATVGTANLDYRSFFINDELNAVFGPGPVVAELEQHFIDDLAQSKEIRIKPWGRRPWSALAAETVGWIARKWL